MRRMQLFCFNSNWWMRLVLPLPILPGFHFVSPGVIQILPFQGKKSLHHQFEFFFEAGCILFVHKDTKDFFDDAKAAHITEC